MSEQGIPGIPCALENLYVDENEPRIPILALAIGFSVLFYRNMKPYYKYSLPELEINEFESEIWRKLPLEKPENVQTLIDNLKTIGVHKLSNTSQILIHLPEDKRQEFIRINHNNPLQKFSTITALKTMNRSSYNLKSVSCLIIATENGQIIIFDCQSFLILHSARVSSHSPVTPSMISVTGVFDVDYRIVIATREGSVCFLQKSWLEGKEIFKTHQPLNGIALMPIDQTIVVVCMSKEILCFSRKGKKLWTTNLPYSIICMVTIPLPHLGITLVCVAMKGGLLQIFSQKELVDQFSISATVSAMTFGRLGQEDYVLILVTNGNELPQTISFNF